MTDTSRPAYSGPALFSYGFRPFFLMAGLFAALIVPLWMAVWSGHVTLGGPFAPIDWHIHEMLFGYPSTVIAGFLFTAIPNWTGRMPTRGWPLMVLATLWVAGRLAVAGAFGLGPVAIMVMDCAFMAGIGAMVVAEIVAGRNWGNLKVVVPVLVYLVANITFHLEAMSQGQADVGRRLGFAMVVMLILLIGGRIIPSFTRNWLMRRAQERDTDPGAMPAPVGRLDAASLGLTLLALMLWVALPESAFAGSGMMLAGVAQGVRLVRWQGWRTMASPLLWMLHLAFAFLPCGLFAVGLGGFELLPAATGLHLLGIGGVGGMTLAVMMRASLAHTGRALEVGPMLTAGFVCVALAAIIRASAPPESGLWLAAGLWTAGFAAFVGHYAPILTTAKAGRKRPNPTGS
jgi:uncharacterized protein involved in response to NO